MADIFWPNDLIPNAATWRLIDSTGIFQSPFSGVTRTVSRPGIRWACNMTFESISSTDRGRLLALLAMLRGRSNRIWLPDFSQVKLGAFTGTELIGNTIFNTTSGWTVSNSQIELYADGGALRVTRTAATSAQYTYADAITSVTSASYLFRAGVTQGRGAFSYDLKLGSTAGGTEVVNGTDQTSGGYVHVVGAANGTTLYASFGDGNAGRNTNDFQRFWTPTVTRCALVSGASQTGSALWIDGLPVSTNGLLLAGDLVAVYAGTNWELKRLTASLNSNSSGEGQLIFEPPLRVTPSDNSPVALIKPVARFIYAEDTMQWETRPGMFSNVSVSFVEDIAA